MTKLRGQRSQCKARHEVSTVTGRKPDRDFWSLPADERETIKAKVRETLELESRLGIYKMIEADDAHERELAPKVKSAARLVEHLAGELRRLSVLLMDIERKRRSGPLSFFLWRHTSEGMAAMEDAYAAAVSGEPQKPLPWEQKPERGPGFVVGMFADVLGGGIAAQMREKASAFKARKGGAPRKVVFNAACRILYEQGKSEKEIAELLLIANLTKGTLAEVQARVKTRLDRDLDPTKPLHAHAKAVEEIDGVDKERMKTLYGEARIGGPPLASLLEPPDASKIGRPSRAGANGNRSYKTPR